MNPPGIASGWRLYVCTDRACSRGRADAKVVRAAIAGGADAIQFREKLAGGRELLRAAAELRALCREAGIPFIVNDRVDIALATEADGVHVGQDDIPAAVARRLIGPDCILGVSAETPAQARQAERDGADYIGAGPVFDARATKPDAAEAIDLDGLAAICRATALPVIAIGGITAASAPLVIRAGAAGVAVISAVVGAEDIKAAARQLRRAVTDALPPGPGASAHV